MCPAMAHTNVQKISSTTITNDSQGSFGNLRDNRCKAARDDISARKMEEVTCCIWIHLGLGVQSPFFIGKEFRVARFSWPDYN